MEGSILLWLVLGVASLILGADLLVRGASTLGAAASISPVVVGLTIVSLGTSAPEIAVSTLAALRGQTDIAFGNVVGSNIMNITLVLGSCAAVSPLIVHQKLVRKDLPILIAVSLLLTLLAWDGNIDEIDSGVLLSLLTIYLVLAVRAGRNEARSSSSGTPATVSLKSVGLALLGVGAGLGLLVVGSDWIVKSAVQLAQHLGVSPLVIGLTVLAAGTSLPELATSVLATVRGERELAVGNVVGSNILNTLAVLGAAGLAATRGVPVQASSLRFDLPVMLAVTLACLPIFWIHHRISRWQGLALLGSYAAYLTVTVLEATSS